MKMSKLRPIVGNWASGDSFFDREEEVWDLIRRIRRGASISVTAPRRIGKTSVLREVNRLLDEEMTCVFVDLEGAATPEDAIAEIAGKAGRHRSLEKVAMGWAQRLLGVAEVDLQVAKFDLRDALRADWQTRGARLVAELCGGPKPVVLFLDELPVLVANLLKQPEVAGRNPADLFLSWLRKLTQDHPDKLRIVLAGSIGLAPLVARAGLSATLNAYEVATLGPWSREITIEALDALAAHETLTLGEGAAARVHELLGIGVPCHVQLVFQAITEDALRRQCQTVTVDDVQRAWEERVLPRPSADLPHWEQRLRKTLPPVEYGLAVRLLTETALAEPLQAERAHEISQKVGAAQPDAMPDPEDSLRAVMVALQHDGYLGRDERGWYFPNRLLKAWWVEQYGPLHIPGARR